MITFFYWSGIVTWAAIAFFGVVWLFDEAADTILTAFKLRKDFIAFLYARSKNHKLPG